MPSSSRVISRTARMMSGRKMVPSSTVTAIATSEELREQLEEQGLSPEKILKELDVRYPPYPVNHDQVRSLAHSSTRVERCVTERTWSWFTG